MLNEGLWLAIRATEILFAWSLGIQTLEYLRMRHAMTDDALWSWRLQRLRAELKHCDRIQALQS